MKRVYHFRDTIRWRIILKIIIKEQGMKFWIGFFWLILSIRKLLFSLYTWFDNFLIRWMNFNFLITILFHRISYICIYVLQVLPFGLNCSWFSSLDSYATRQDPWALFKIPRNFGIKYDPRNFKNKTEVDFTKN